MLMQREGSSNLAVDVFPGRKKTGSSERSFDFALTTRTTGASIGGVFYVSGVGASEGVDVSVGYPVSADEHEHAVSLTALMRHVYFVVHSPGCSPVASRFTQHLLSLQKRNTQEANRFVFVTVDRMIARKEFREIESILDDLPVHEYKTAVLLSLLSITGIPAGRKNLSAARKSLFGRVKKHLMRKENDAHKVRKLLYGLE